MKIYQYIIIFFLVSLGFFLIILAENAFRSDREKVEHANIIKPADINSGLTGFNVFEIPLKHISSVKFEIPGCTNSDCTEYEIREQKKGLAYASVTLEREENGEWKKKIVDGKWGNLTIGTVNFDLNKAESHVDKKTTEIYKNVYLQNPETLSGLAGGELRAFAEYIEIEEKNIYIIGTVYNSEINTNELFVISDKNFEDTLNLFDDSIPQNKSFMRIIGSFSIITGVIYLAASLAKKKKH